ncbi:glycosyltransferase [Psychrobacillus sp.]|uniref:glycosyltransferase family 2 protein n=1 Tax=Psychrobacillus sp. TaxID=1871623 RepID=UPI0028BEBE5B|nr:glycosyltransferase [Psychrobacillus sp.]
MTNMMVSINCVTYNHENHIAKAIESFLMQKTNFDFEILIHDDASSDNTPEIIKEYATKYPGKINIIYQTENQYSKGKRIFSLNALRATGKYIAICEGDDYWISPYKLQKQVDYMEQNSNCSLCVHAGNIMNSLTGEIIKPHHDYFENKYFSVEEVIKGAGANFLTNSMFYRAEYKDDSPSFLTNAPVGDYPLAINLALKGDVYYINEILSAYNVNVENSWTNRVSNNRSKRISHYYKLLNMYEELDAYTKYHYKKTIRKMKFKYYIHLLYFTFGGPFFLRNLFVKRKSQKI